MLKAAGADSPHGPKLYTPDSTLANPVSGDLAERRCWTDILNEGGIASVGADMPALKELHHQKGAEESAGRAPKCAAVKLT